MPFAVVLRHDPAGSCVVVLRHEDEPLTFGPGISYKVVAQRAPTSFSCRFPKALDKASKLTKPSVQVQKNKLFSHTRDKNVCDSLISRVAERLTN